MNVTGDFRLNGRECDAKMMKSVSAYVAQDDLLHAELTVEETLRGSAQLRMPLTATDAERALRVQQVTDLMGIAHCAKTIVGNTRRKGISNGERKRLCIAIELLNRPKLIFLDEPTSGLDNADAFLLCKTLKNLSTVGECTTVCTIHQPAPNTFALFDDLILMKSGEAVYQGNVQGITAFLQQIRRPCPSDVCLSDHLLEAVSPTGVSKDKLVQNSMIVVPVDLEVGREMYDFSEFTDIRMLSFKTWILCERNFKLALRNYHTLLLGVGSTLVIAFLISGGVWQHLGNNQASTSKIPSALFFTCVNQGIVASFMTVNSFPGERAIMLRERQAGAYTTLAYFLAKSLTDTVVLFPLPILFSVIVYPMFGLQPVASKFFLYMMFMVFDSMAATALATMVTCLCVTVEISTVVLGLLFEVCRLYGGFFTSPLQLEAYPGWGLAVALSYIKYAFVGVALNELNGQDFVCDPGEVCKVMSGEQIAAAKGYDHYTIGYCAGVLVLYIFGCRAIAYLALKFVRI
jgi:ATP-binding cassette subfamily G (WHITE) protein 2